MSTIECIFKKVKNQKHCAMSVDEYDKECRVQKKRNKKFLKDFQNDLEAKGLTKKTIERHMSNVDFYINEYLF